MNFAPLLQLVEKEAKQAPSALGGEQIQSMLGNTHKKKHPLGDHNQTYRYYSYERVPTSALTYCYIQETTSSGEKCEIRSCERRWD